MLPKAGRACVGASIERFITTPTGTGPETAEAAAVATRDHQWAVRRLTDCVTKISDSLLACLVGDGSGFAGLVHLFGDSWFFGIPQTSLGGFGM
jgi:hypothetical protein